MRSWLFSWLIAGTIFATGSASVLSLAQEETFGDSIDDFSALQPSGVDDPLFTDPEEPMPPVGPAAGAGPGALKATGEEEPAALAAFESGRTLLEQGDAQGAIRQFNRAIALEPSFTAAYVGRARASAAMNHSAPAIKSYAKAIALASDPQQRASVYLERGKEYFNTDEHRRALDDFNRAAEQFPASADVAHQRGRALLRIAGEQVAAGEVTARQTITQAISALDRAIAINPGLAEALADRGRARADLGETDEAIEDLGQAATLDAGDATLHFALAVLHLQRATAARNAEGDRRDDLQTAVAKLSEAMEIDQQADDEEPSSPSDVEFDPVQSQLTRAVAQIELASVAEPDARAALYNAALQDCEAVILEDPTIAVAHFQSGVAHRMLGNFSSAVEAFTEAIRLSPENAEARIRRGIAWYYLGEADLAAADFHAVGLIPGDPRPMFWLGVVHAARGEHRDAIREYSDAIGENRRYAIAYQNRALSLMHLGQWQRAIDDLNEAIQINPRDQLAYSRRALAQRRLGRHEAARRSLELAERFQP